MKPRHFIAIQITAHLALAISQQNAFGQAARIATQYGDDAIRLAPILLGLAADLGGIVAIVTAGIYARDKKTDESLGLAGITSAIGGMWTAYTWFGWPMINSSQTVMIPGNWFTPNRFEQITQSQFSILALLGLIAFGVIGIVLCISIAQLDISKSDN